MQDRKAPFHDVIQFGAGWLLSVMLLSGATLLRITRKNRSGLAWSIAATAGGSHRHSSRGDPCVDPGRDLAIDDENHGKVTCSSSVSWQRRPPVEGREEGSGVGLVLR